MNLSVSGFVFLLPLAALAATAYSLILARRESLGNVGATAAEKKLQWIVVALLVALVFLASLQLDAAFSIDTAENIADGHGFVYNDGQRVLGTSTPLFTLALAGLRLVGVPIETGSLMLSLLAVSVLVGLLVRIGHSLNSLGSGLLAAALLCVEAPFLVYSTQGMETSCYAALILGTFACHLEGREKAAAILAAMCVLMRLDGLAVPAALAVSYLVERRRPSPVALALFAGLCAPWFIFSEVYFGHVLPQSMLAKLTHTKYAGRWWMLRYIFLDEGLLFVPFGLIGGAVVCLGRSGARRLAIPTWLVLYGAAFSIVSIDAYPWYRIPLAPLMALLASVGLYLTLVGLFRAWPDAAQRIAVVAVLGAIAPFALKHYITYRDSIEAYSEQLRVWEQPRIAAAEWLRDHARQGSTVAAAGIGQIGWISGLRVLDTAGLVSPELVKGFDPRRDKPDFVVGHDEDSLPGHVFQVGDPDYQLVKSLAVDPSVVYRIYKRRETVLREPRPPSSEETRANASADVLEGAP